MEEQNTGVEPAADENVESSPTEHDDRFLPQPEDEEEQEAAESERESDDESDDEDESGDESTDKPKKKGVQKRFSELTARAKAAERERDFIAEQNRQILERFGRLEQQQTPEQNKQMQEAAPAPPGIPPDRYDFASDSEFEAAVKDYQDRTINYTKFLIREEQKAAMTEAQKREMQRQQMEASQRLTTEIKTIKDKGAEKFEDFDDVADIPLNVVGLVAQMESAVDMAYHWGKHPEERNQIAQLAEVNPIAAAVKIGELNASFKNKAKQTTKAPPPPKTVGSNNSAKVNPDSLSMDEWVKQRRAGKIK